MPTAGCAKATNVLHTQNSATPAAAAASWIVTTDGGSNLVKSFKVASVAPGAEKTDVGQLVLKLEEPAKPAGK